MMSSGVIQPNQFPNLSDTRCLLGCGPFTLRPAGDPAPDTLLIAFAIVSGQSLTTMRQDAVQARVLYENGGVVGVGGQRHVAQFALEQNYPNPFNPSTTIRFSLERPGFARLSIYNLLGQEVATICATDLGAGQHTMKWDARNLPSGVYFYRLESDRFDETKRLILAR